MAKKRISKKELKGDAFVSFFFNSWEYIKTHQNQLFIGVIAIIIIIAAVSWYFNSREAAKVESSARFAEAISFYNSGDMASAKELLKIVKNRYGSTMEGAFSRYFMGKIAMAEGNNEQAISHFEDYLSRAGSYPFYRDSAREAIAICMMNERRFDEAAQIYLELSSEKEEDEREEYLEKAAETYEMADSRGKALEVYRQLLGMKEGLAKKKIEIKISILTG